MAQTLQQILGGINKTQTVQQIRSGLPNVLPAGFLTTHQRVVGRSVAFDKVSGQRAFATTTQYGAPARDVTQLGRTRAAAGMIHAFESIHHDPLILQNLMRQDSDAIQALAVDEVLRQTREFLVRFANLRLGAVYSMLANGKIWLDADGRLLFSSSGAAETIDFGVPTGQTGQIGGAINASWATASTDIVGQVQAIKKLAVQTTGFPLAHAFYGQNIVKHLLANDQAPELIQGNPELATAFFTAGEIPRGFCGLQWHPVYQAAGLNPAGQMADFFGPNTVVFTPEPSVDWYDLAEGSYLTPGSLGEVSGDAGGAARSLEQVFGMFSYAKVTDNPATIQHFAGDTFLPLLKNGRAIFIATVAGF